MTPNKLPPLPGYVEGERCGRERCAGIVSHREVEGCACHICPPCSDCTEPRAICETCGWDERDDERMNGFVGSKTNAGIVWTLRPLDPSKIDWHSKSHTHFSMVKEGVYPEGTSRADVELLVKGTFSGKFDYFDNGRFRYVAYTD